MAQIVQYNGVNIEFPDNMAPAEIEAAIKKNSLSLPPKAAATGPSTRMDRFAQGLRDPLDGGAQLLTNILPESVVQAGNRLNNWLADTTGLVGKIPEGGLNQQQAERNATYEANRAAAGETGFDGYRALGNILNPVALAPVASLPRAASLAGRVAVGATSGAFGGALAPVNQGDFTEEKTRQLALGTLLGGAVPAAISGAARVISPNASKNANLALLKKEGVQPTIGQTLGGRWNAVEEKLTSLPVVGDMISKARTQAQEQFNTAAINRATGAVSVKVQGAGQAAVKEAGDVLSGVYDDAMNQIKVVKFDGRFANDVKHLQGMAQNLTPEMRNKFNTTLQNIVGGRMSGKGSMLGPTFKKVDSELGQLSARYGKSNIASESELGDALKQLQALLKQQAMRSNPDAAKALAAADDGWANLVRIEGAAKAAQNADGVFTPAQLNAAIRGADSSVRGRAVARGDALMQDLGNAGQAVLGNKVSNSHTVDRALMGAGALGSGFINPAIPAGLLGGAALYSNPIQRGLTFAVTARPQIAQPIAQTLRQAPAGLGLLGFQAGSGLLNN